MFDVFADLGLSLYLVAAVFIMLGAMLQSSIGIGFGMFAAPFLALIEPRLVPGSVLMMGMCVSTLIVVRELRSVDFDGLSWALGGRLVGALI